MYDPVVNGKHLDFGISGLLYQSTAILYDTRTESLWSQIGAEAISGRYMGTPLPKVAASDTTWGVWRAEHPDTLVLSDDTGYKRNYGIDRYALVQGRGATAEPTFPVTHRDDRLPPQTQVFGVEIGGVTKAYPVPALVEAPVAFTDDVGRAVVHIANDPPGKRFTLTTTDGRAVPYQNVYWYAWVAFNPDTELFTPPSGERATDIAAGPGTGEAS